MTPSPSRAVRIDVDALHRDIMNLPCRPLESSEAYADVITAYRIGHRDARHAAAELVAVTLSQETAQGEPSLPDTCDGKEQEAFEQFLRDNKLSTATHPLHYLFTDPKSYAARQAWKAAIKYCRSAAAPREVAAAPVQPNTVEAAAKAIYDCWKHNDGWRPWVEGGNSMKQDEARSCARAALAAASPVQSEPAAQGEPLTEAEVEYCEAYLEELTGGRIVDNSIRRLVEFARLSAAPREVAAAPVQPDALGYATRLAESTWRKHYQQDAPNWQPADNLMFVLSQIDNMLTGLVRAAPVQPETAVHQAAGWAAAVAALLKDAGYSVEWSAIDCIRDLIRRAAPVQAAPAGWKLVPLELTQAMRDAWDTAPNGEDDDENMRAAYRALLAASPIPQQSGSAPAARMTADEIHAHDWWCPHCCASVPPEMVTKDGEHYLESGGCGRPVRGELKDAPAASQEGGRVDASTDGVTLPGDGQQHRCDGCPETAGAYCWRNCLDKKPAPVSQEVKHVG